MSDPMQVSPTELKFKFELRKNIPVLLTLTNSSSEKQAFKVKTTSPKTYCVRPSSGFVEPNSTMTVQIIRQAQRDYPSAYGDTKDKFLVQSSKVPASLNEVTNDLFDSTKNPDMQQVKLRVALVGPPQPPSPVPEHPESGETEDATAVTRGFASDAAKDSGVPSSVPASEMAGIREKAERAERENAELRKKLVARGGAGQTGGLNFIHLVLVALIAFLIGYFLK